MRYANTANAHVVSLSEAMDKGMEDDGGLYIPQTLPKVDMEAFLGITDYSDFAYQVLAPFFEEDPLASQLNSICKAAFSFPVWTQKVHDALYFMELFHGPTLSFKDFGAQFLAQCLSRIKTTKPRLMMVATSGDTGSAVAAAFHKIEGVQAMILFPKDKISKRQQKQITSFGDNIIALAVEGTFDDCQKLVKSALVDPWWQERFAINTANSINIGRLLGQIVYYAYCSCQYYKEHQQKIGFIVPSGNIGNVTAAYYALKMGFPIREIVLSTNANKVVPEYIESGVLKPRGSIETLANAMDVGNPSNLVRLQHLLGDFEHFKSTVRAFSVEDSKIEEAIVDCHQKYGVFLCPHTATAYSVWKHHLDQAPFMLVATADASKFETVVEPLVKQKVLVPETLAKMLEKKEQYSVIAQDPVALKNAVLD